jgi:hypothetical protein
MGIEGEYTYVMDKIRTLTVENKLLKERIAELESSIRKLMDASTLESQENVMAELEELLKEQGEW